MFYDQAMMWELMGKVWQRLIHPFIHPSIHGGVISTPIKTESQREMDMYLIEEGITTLNIVLNVTCYLELCNLIYCKFQIQSTNVKLVVWTL